MDFPPCDEKGGRKDSIKDSIKDGIKEMRPAHGDFFMRRLHLFYAVSLSGKSVRRKACQGFLLSGSSCGSSHDQVSVEQDCADGHSVHQAAEGIIAAFPELGPVLAHRGQGRGSVRADRDVVEADDADIPGHLVPELPGTG